MKVLLSCTVVITVDYFFHSILLKRKKFKKKICKTLGFTLTFSHLGLALISFSNTLRRYMGCTPRSKNIFQTKMYQLCTLRKILCGNIQHNDQNIMNEVLTKVPKTDGRGVRLCTQSYITLRVLNGNVLRNLNQSTVLRIQVT